MNKSQPAWNPVGHKKDIGLHSERGGIVWPG